MQSATDILEADHRELHVLLRAAVAAVNVGDLNRSFEATDLFWARLAMHIRAEHLHLFPFVRAIGSPDLGEILTDLRRDHDSFMTDLGRAMKALRLAFDFGNEAVTFERVHELLKGIATRLASHDNLEEASIYALVDPEAIPSKETESLRAGIAKELGNYPPRFAAGSR